MLLSGLMLLSQTLFSPFADPFDGASRRLVGKYSGPMVYFDEIEHKEKSFSIDIEISFYKKKAVLVFDWTYRYAEPRFSQEREECSVLNGGKSWQAVSIVEKQSKTLSFELRKWDAFAEGKSDWFEIERDRTGAKSEVLTAFRRRFTLHHDGLVSEKWLRSPGKPWGFSHKMTLKRG